MKKSLKKKICSILMSLGLALGGDCSHYIQAPPIRIEAVNITEIKVIEEVPDETNVEIEQSPVTPVAMPKEEFLYSDEEIRLLTIVMIAEAEGESDTGKRLVVDTVLNRVESDYFPNTVYDVIYQPYQFTSMSNGRASSVSITDADIATVRDEVINQTNRDVLYFTAYHFGEYGTPLFQVGNHFFCAQ